MCHAYLSIHNCRDTNTRPVQINDLRFICDTSTKASPVHENVLGNIMKTDLSLLESRTIMDLTNSLRVIFGQPKIKTSHLGSFE